MVIFNSVSSSDMRVNNKANSESDMFFTFITTASTQIFAAIIMKIVFEIYLKKESMHWNRRLL